MSTLAARRGPRARLRLPPPHLLAALALVAACGWVAVEGHGGKVLDTVPDGARALVAALALFAVCGYPVARVLTPRSMLAHMPLLVVPLGAMTSALALTFLGAAQVPFVVSLSLLIAAALVGCVLAARRPLPAPPEEERRRAGSALMRLWWPVLIALALAGLCMIPAFRVGEVATLGANPDAHLVTGAAEVVRHGGPASIQPDLPVDRVSTYWRSKYPIYYSLAAVCALSGLDPIQVFPVLSALLLGGFAIGLLLLAFYAFRAGPVASLLAMGIAGGDRIALHLVVHPYYNQLWGTVAFPFMLLFGLRYLREPDRRTAALFALAFGVGLFAYPLMVPFPIVALGVPAYIIWRRRGAEGRSPGWLSELHLPRIRRKAVLVPLYAFGALVVLGLTLAGVSKMVSAAGVIRPGGDLSRWAGDIPKHPFGRYFGLPDLGWLTIVPGIALAGAALAGIQRLPRPERLGLIAMAVAALAMGVWFLTRLLGEYFAFKALAFLGPIVLCAAVVGLSAWRPQGPLRLAGPAALAVLALTAVVGARDELESVPIQTPREIVQLRDWSDRLPADASIRIDTIQGPQLWAAYMLHEHPLSSSAPVLRTTYPHVPFGLKADYVLAEIPPQQRPRGALGVPVLRNSRFRIYRLDPGLRGPDRSSRRREQP